MAPAAQTLEHRPHLPFLSIMQYRGSMVATFGTACAKGMYTAWRSSMPRLNSLGTCFMGHFSVQAPQPVHTSSFT